MDENLHSPQRQLIELRMAHADLDSLIDSAVSLVTTGREPLSQPVLDDLTLRRLKKQRLALRDQIARLQGQIDPPEPA
jgi:hypothetical protein